MWPADVRVSLRLWVLVSGLIKVYLCVYARSKVPWLWVVSHFRCYIHGDCQQRNTNKQTHKQTNKQTEGQTEEKLKMDRHTDGQPCWSASVTNRQSDLEEVTLQFYKKWHRCLDNLVVVVDVVAVVVIVVAVVVLLLLLLRSQAISLRFTILGEIFAYVTVFF